MTKILIKTPKEKSDKTRKIGIILIKIKNKETPNKIISALKFALKRSLFLKKDLKFELFFSEKLVKRTPKIRSIKDPIIYSKDTLKKFSE